MPSLLRLYAALENRALDVLMTGRRLTRKTLATTEQSKDTVPTDWHFLRRIMSEFDFREGDKIVDVGCGTGRVLVYLAKRFPYAGLIGIEINEDVARIAAEIVPSRCEIIAGDILDACPPDANVFYMFNPFHAEQMKDFCEKILNPMNSFTVIYAVPAHLDVIEKYCNNTTIEIRNVRSRLRNLSREYAVVKK